MATIVAAAINTVMDKNISLITNKRLSRPAFFPSAPRVPSRSTALKSAPEFFQAGNKPVVKIVANKKPENIFMSKNQLFTKIGILVYHSPHDFRLSRLPY